MSKNGYKKLEGIIGIYQNMSSLHYLAIKKVKGKNYQKSFKSLPLAKKWRKNLSENPQLFILHCKKATLREVWASMQTDHFPSLAMNTVAIWRRRYLLVKQLENLPMDEIIPSTITAWVNKNVEHFKSRDVEDEGSGKHGRCNLNNELNLFVTIFNWYKQSERYENEALH